MIANTYLNKTRNRIQAVSDTSIFTVGQHVQNIGNLGHASLTRPPRLCLAEDLVSMYGPRNEGP